MTEPFDKLSKSVSPEEGKALCDFLAFSTRPGVGGREAEERILVSLALALSHTAQHA